MQRRRLCCYLVQDGFADCARCRPRVRVKLLVAIEPDTIVVEQFNPPAWYELPMRDVIAALDAFLREALPPTSAQAGEQ